MSSSETSLKKTTAKKAAPKVATEKTIKDKPTKEKTPKTATAKTSTRKKTAKPAILTSEERIKMIEVAAYYIAEKNGFGTNHMDYWLQAEQEVDAKLNA